MSYRLFGLQRDFERDSILALPVLSRKMWGNQAMFGHRPESNSRSLAVAIAALLLLMLAACMPQVEAAPTTPEHIYTTWSTLELDSCAAAWLIKRFVDKKAEFHFVPQGELIDFGIPFDVPGAALARTHDHTTYTAITTAFDIHDPAIEQIAQIVHSVEIDYWAGIEDPLTQMVATDIRQIVASTSDPQIALEQSFIYFDRLYDSLGKTQ